MKLYLPNEGVYVSAERLTSAMTVLALDRESWRLEPRLVLACRQRGAAAGYALETRLGRRIVASADSRLLTLAGWRSLSALAPGTSVALPRRLPGPSVATLAKKELELIACLLADRWSLAEGRLTYVARDEEQAQIFAGLVRRMFGRSGSPQVAAGPAGYHVQVRAEGAVAGWLERMGLLGVPAHQRRVPDPLWAQPMRGLNYALRRLWTSAGTVVMRRGHAPQICYRSPSPEVARGLQSLLLRHDVNAIVTTEDREGRSDVGSGAARCYTLHLSGKHDIARFIKLMGLQIERWERSVTAIKEYLAGHTGITSRDLLPREAWELLVVPAMQAAGVSERQVQAALGYPPFATGQAGLQLSRNRAAQLAQIVQSQTLARLAESDIYWDEVVSCEPAGAAAGVELEVEGADSVVADDGIVQAAHMAAD